MALPVFGVPVFTQPCGGIQASSWPAAFETTVIIASMNSKQIKTLAAIFAVLHQFHCVFSLLRDNP
jgi:hypothetical protein